jgi:hypothetical protein
VFLQIWYEVALSSDGTETSDYKEGDEHEDSASRQLLTLDRYSRVDQQRPATESFHDKERPNNAQYLDTIDDDLQSA